MPVSVSVSKPAARAMPKSETRIDPSSASRRFPGFTSRWTTPRACAESSAAAVCSSQPSASCRSTRPSRNRSATVPPGAYSITMKGSPSSFSPTSWIVTTYGSPESRAAVCASRRKRARNSSSRAYRSESTLIATVRPSFSSVARQTSPMPPRAMIPATS